MLQGRLVDLDTCLLSQKLLLMKVNPCQSVCQKTSQRQSFKVYARFFVYMNVATGVTCVNNILMNLLST